MKLVYILPGIFFLIMIVFVLYENLFQPSYSCKLSKEFNSSSYRGIVLKKIIDKENHSTRSLQIKYNNEIFDMPLLRDTSGYFEYVMAGDSLVKVKNDSDIRVIRKAVTRDFKIYFGCE